MINRKLILLIFAITNTHILNSQSKIQPEELYLPYVSDAQQWYDQFGKQLTAEQLTSIATAINYGLEFAVAEFQNANSKIGEKLKTTFDGLKTNIESSPGFKQAIDQMAIKLGPLVQQIDKTNKELFGRTFAYYKQIQSIEKKFKFEPPPLIKDEKVDQMLAKFKKPTAKTVESEGKKTTIKNGQLEKKENQINTKANANKKT